VVVTSYREYRRFGIDNRMEEISKFHWNDVCEGKLRIGRTRCCAPFAGVRKERVPALAIYELPRVNATCRFKQSLKLYKKDGKYIG